MDSFTPQMFIDGLACGEYALLFLSICVCVYSVQDTQPFLREVAELGEQKKATDMRVWTRVEPGAGCGCT